MKITNNYNLPQSLVNAVTFNNHKKGSGFSVTEILKPIRMIWLAKRHEDELEEDASGRIWALLGSAIHSILERNADKNSLQEQYLTHTIDGVELSGSPDLLDDKGMLSDYKITSVWSTVYGSRMAEWTQQINCYSWLYGKAGFPVKKAEVIAIYRDWSRGRAYDPKYPQSNVERVEIELWSPEQQEEFVRSKLRGITVHKDTPDAELPECSTEDKWEKPTVWALMKKGRKSAVRLYSTKPEAEAALSEGKGNEIIERKGECTRCQEYCNVRAFCPTFLAGSPPPVNDFDAELARAKRETALPEATFDMLIDMPKKDV
jgi:hypothetical protein